MCTRKTSRTAVMNTGLAALVFALVITPVNSMQLEGAMGSAALADAKTQPAPDTPAVAAAGPAVWPARERESRPAAVPAQAIESDKITSFFVRAADSKRILLSMLVAYKAELTQAVRQMTGQNVTPLVFSVTTLPHRTVNFDPNLLRLEQGGRVWQPQVSEQTLDVFPLEEGASFGGKLRDGEVQQGVVLLPEWFDPKAPITLRYGDFHFLAQFALARD